MNLGEARPVSADPRPEEHDLAVLSSEECLELLGTRVVGRVAFTDRSLPQVFPVSYVMDGSAIVFRTSAKGRLAESCRNAVVAFQVDSFEETEPARWTVLAVGSSRVLNHESEKVRASQLGIRPLPLGRRETFVRITPGMLTGRRLE